MSENSPAYDVRVIRLSKSASTKTLREFMNEECGRYQECDRYQECSRYICLGHFDMLQAIPLPPSTFPLKTIQDDIQKGCHGQQTAENYCYPLYILKQLSRAGQTPAEAQTVKKARGDLKNFWVAKRNFFFVSRFHCDHIDSSKVPFSQSLEERCRSFDRIDPDMPLSISTDIKGYISYHTNDSSEVASVVFYDSLELGDIVGVIKSDSLTVAMKLLQHLYECRVISDAYTYCGVDRALLRCEDFLGNLPPDRQFPLETYQMIHAATRFSVKYAQSADKLLQPLKKELGSVDFVTGTADVIVKWVPCTEAEFLRQIGKVVRFEKLYEAFLDIITRIGTEYRPPRDSRQDLYQKPLFSERVPKAEKVSRLFSGELERWRYPTTRLLGTLRAMYENSVMDELSLLLIPGVNAFLERISYLHEQRLWQADYDEDVSNFLDWWAALASDISHLESQMVQHPELTPARHYIPAMVLQFERNFVEDYVKVIQELDRKAASEDKEPRSFVPILFPTLEENIHTLCPMDPAHDTSYKKDSPLCIFLPIHRIYQPWEIAHMLGHEIQHYSSDSLRCRDERLDCLVQSASAFVTAFLGAYVSESYQYQKATIERERRFQREIAKSIHQLLSPDTVEHAYLRSVEEDLPKAMFEVAINRKNQEELQNILFYKAPPEEQMAQIRQMCSVNALEVGVSLSEAFFQHVHYLSHLYKECFADISMILVLKCSFSDYYHCIYEEEAGRFGIEPRTHQEKRFFERHTDRLAMVMIAMERMEKDWALEALVNVDSSWAVTAWEKAKHWQDVRDLKDAETYTWERHYNNAGMDGFALLADEAQQLESYLTKCAGDLKSHLDSNSGENSPVGQLRKHLTLVKDTSFDWSETRMYLDMNLP